MRRGLGFCCGGGDGASGLELVAGVTGDGVRAVPLSFNSTVELIQIVGQVQVVNGVWGFRFIVSDLAEDPSDRTGVVCVC